MTRLILLLGALTLTGCREAFVAHVDVVARAGPSELSVNRLAEIVAPASGIPLDPEVVELLAFRWVELAVFAERTAVGDSLLDSAMVLETVWPSARGMVVDSFHTLIVQERMRVASGQVDSAYAAGELRYISHVLRRVTDSTTETEKEAQRARAQRIRDALDVGGTWAAANQQNEDSVARARSGGLGVLSRGSTVQGFEDVAFALEPGETSPVTETAFGFHVIYRPPLEEVREPFTEAVRDRLTQRLDSAYQDELAAERRLELFPNAPAIMREAARFPLRARTSDKVIASFDGGRFLVRDFVRWLQILPTQISQQATSAPDDQLRQLGRSLVMRELIWREAAGAGVHLTADQWSALREGYRAELAALRGAMQLEPDSLLAYGATPDERQRVAFLAVDRFFERGVQDTRQLRSVPPFLADQLLEDAVWEIDPAGVRRAVERAAELRGALPGGRARETNPGDGS